MLYNGRHNPEQKYLQLTENLLFIRVKGSNRSSQSVRKVTQALVVYWDENKDAQGLIDRALVINFS